MRARRLPDQGLVRRRAVYEVEHPAPGSAGQAQRSVTSHPTRLIAELYGGHRQDAAPVVLAADLGWDGGTGLWRGASAEDSEPASTADRHHDGDLDRGDVERRARRLVESRGTSSVGALSLLGDALSAAGEGELARDAGVLLQRLMVARSEDEKRVADQELTAYLQRVGDASAGGLVDASHMERTTVGLLVARLGQLGART